MLCLFSFQHTMKRDVMQNICKNFFHGSLIGIAIIIPGFSGSTLAYIFGFYESLLSAFTDFFIHPKQSLKFLIPFGLGICLSILILIFPLFFFLKVAPFSMTCFFAGLFIGSLPDFIKEESFLKKHAFSYILFGFFLSFLFSKLPFVQIPSSFDFGTYDIFFITFLLFSGSILAIGLITPGLSLTFLLLSIGLYYPFIDLIEMLFQGIFSFPLFLNLSVLFLSFLITLFFYSRFLKKIMSRHKEAMNLFIIGIVFSTFLQAFLAKDSVPNLPRDVSFYQLCYTFLCGILLFLLGFYLVYSLEKKRKKKGKNSMRLDRYVTYSGIGTRRNVKKTIRRGHIKVNSELVFDPSFSVDENKDQVYYDDQLLDYQEYRYVLLYKPKGYISSTIKERNYPPVTDLVADLGYRNLAPVGRLDCDTTGLLLLTNDGKLAHQLLAPKFHVDKSYLVETDYPIPSDLKEKFSKGIKVLDYVTLPAKLEILEPTKAIITLHEGKYHQIKRMFLTCGCKVINLHRLTFAFLTLDGLKEGAYRLLTKEEVERLRSL